MAEPKPVTKPTPQLLYDIVSTREQFQLDDTGRLVEMKVIYYITALGDTGSISIPKSQFSAELAEKLLAAQVSEIYKLRGV